MATLGDRAEAIPENGVVRKQITPKRTKRSRLFGCLMVPHPYVQALITKSDHEPLDSQPLQRERDPLDAV